MGARLAVSFLGQALEPSGSRVAIECSVGVRTVIAEPERKRKSGPDKARRKRRLAGIIAATGGATAAFAVDGLSYVVSIATIVMMRPVARATLGEEGITWRALLEGWRYARGRQDLLGTYLIDINATFFGMPNALFPAMAEQWGAASVGLLYAAPPLGAMAAAITSRWALGVHRHGLAITWAA